MKFYQMNLSLDNKKFNNEREFHKYLFNYLNKYVDNIEYEKFCNKQIRPDIYFEYKNQKYVLECKYISKQFSHNDIANFLVQMFEYKQYFGEDHIFLCAIYAENEIILKKFGDGFLYPTSQMFSAFGFYFLKWKDDFPKHYTSEDNCFLSYSNGSGIIDLVK